ncbi:MAG: hypothetical protein ACRD2K_02125 [Terriglobales bacterium]
MKTFLRIMTATLLLAACVSAAAPARINTKQGLQEGPSPVPLCDPSDPKCKKPIPTEAPAHP